MRGKTCRRMPSSSNFGMLCGEPLVVFHQEDAPGQCVKVIAAYYVSSPIIKVRWRGQKPTRKQVV